MGSAKGVGVRFRFEIFKKSFLWGPKLDFEILEFLQKKKKKGWVLKKKTGGD